ncbi:unnamed protein product [Prorocentrum cordatum]|uniref:Uncharacterized protein n=1 Tax=Prorocentrum cordatum TaxID=2364126 RepID=A0ABN9SRT8_9DINO|nr:unnamed protein product [Polarella glacialis]
MSSGLGSRTELGEQVNRSVGELARRQERLIPQARRAAGEALRTCGRLADDSLAASEATQQKLRDLGDGVEERWGAQERWVQRRLEEHCSRLTSASCWSSGAWRSSGQSQSRTCRADHDGDRRRRPGGDRPTGRGRSAG